MYGDGPDCQPPGKNVPRQLNAHVAILAKSQLGEIEQNSAALKELEPL